MTNVDELASLDGGAAATGMTIVEGLGGAAEATSVTCDWSAESLAGRFDVVDRASSRLMAARTR